MSDKTIIDFQAYKNERNETISVCKDIISREERGESTGMVYAVRQCNGHVIGATGSYKMHSEDVCLVAGALFIHYNELGGPLIKTK